MGVHSVHGACSRSFGLFSGDAGLEFTLVGCDLSLPFLGRQSQGIAAPGLAFS